MKDLVKLQPELKKKTLTAKQKKLSNFYLGSKGEQLACNYLIKNNYKIIDINIRVKNNEVDIIALDLIQNELAFVEVKTRNGYDFGTPALAVSNQKLKSMAFVARHFLQQYNCNLDYRFDIIAISYFGKKEEVGKGGASAEPKTPAKIEHFENISWP